MADAADSHLKYEFVKVTYIYLNLILSVVLFWVVKIPCDFLDLYPHSTCPVYFIGCWKKDFVLKCNIVCLISVIFETKKI